MSESLTTDLAHLRKIGEFDFPAIAGDFQATADALAQVSYSASKLFVTPASGGAESPVRGEWLALLELTQNVSAKTCVNLRDIGTGIVNVANAFAADDDNHGTSLEALENEMEVIETGHPDRDGKVTEEKPDPVGEPETLDIPDHLIPEATTPADDLNG